MRPRARRRELRPHVLTGLQLLDRRIKEETCLPVE